MPLAEADEARFRAALRRLEVEILLETTLRSVPGGVHLHLRPRTERKGVLEYTLDRDAGQAWLSWHANRYQSWIERLVSELVEETP